MRYIDSVRDIKIEKKIERENEIRKTIERWRKETEETVSERADMRCIDSDTEKVIKKKDRNKRKKIGV